MPLLAIATVVLGLLLLCACLAIYQLMVQQGKLTLQLETLEENLRQQGIDVDPAPPRTLGRPVGHVLNNFELPELSGGTMTLWQFRGRKVLLIFVDPACVHSRALLPDLADLAAEAQPDWPEPVIISTGSPDENRHMFARHEITYPILLQEAMEVGELQLVPGTPMGYSIDETGATVANLLVGRDELLQAARNHTAPGRPLANSPRVGRDYSRTIHHPQREGLEPGTAAPSFSLPQLDGTELALESFRGRKVLLVFSDPACIPCVELAAKLEEIHRGSDAPAVLMIGRGDSDTNRRWAAEHKTTFPTVLQRHWEISRAYRMFATPVGYLIDEQGIVISEVLIGVDAIVNAASSKEARTTARTKVLAPQ